MLQQEREHLAGVAMRSVAEVFDSRPGSFYDDSVQHKLILLLQAMDRVAVATDKPVLFGDILPGFDVVILRNVDVSLNLAEGGNPLDERALSSVDETCLAILGHGLEHHLAQRAKSGGEDHGVYVYEGGDGLHYFCFRTAYRAAVLAEMGVSPDGLIDGSDLVSGGKGQETIQ